MALKVGLAIDALSPELTGIGRYCRALAFGLPRDPRVGDVRYFRFGRWYRRPDHFLGNPKPPGLLGWRMLQKRLAPLGFRGRLFHGPNFFLPERAERGVVTVHDLSVLRFPEMHPPERIRHFERDFQATLARASRIITPSQFIRAEVLQHFGWPTDRVTAVPMGVGPAYFAADRAAALPVLRRYRLDDAPYLLCVATLEPRKGLDRTLRAFSQFRARSGRDYRLAIVGAEGWRNEALLAQIGEAERRGWARRLGFVPEVDLPALYCGAQLFLYLSLYEGFGMPPIEAMAAGVPAVVSDRASLPEVTQGAALTANPDDIDALSRAIERALGDDSWRSGAIEAGRAVARTYTWDRCIEETVSVYEAA